MNQPNSITKTWQQYEAGKEYKRRIGLYERIRENERFYRGDQWSDGEGGDLPKPVFNVIRRVVDYLICTVAAGNLEIRYTDEHLPFLQSKKEAERLREGLRVLSANASYRWEQSAMDRKLLRLLTDAAITGDGVLYCYWDADARSPQLFCGDIATEIIDSVGLFVADVNRADLQAQDYLILAGRASVASLREEARRAGRPDAELLKILPDTDYDAQGGSMGSFELGGDEEAKATYLVKFWREDGRVCFEKSTRECLIRSARTECRRYPVAYFNWQATKNSFHGTSPITHLIPNQKFINRAYAMAMKHMQSTAFSKIVYDKSKIPEWSNEVGEAIAAMGGGNISDAVSVIGVGQMQSGYMELIDSAITVTKEMLGATESALGNTDATNTSAILALQETSRIPLEQIRTAFYACIEDLANIWADMMCAYYPAERLLPYHTREGVRADTVDFDLLREGFLSARIDVAELTRFTAASAQNMLDKLLEWGYISPESYVRRLPSGLVCDRQALIEEIAAKEEATETEAGDE